MSDQQLMMDGSKEALAKLKERQGIRKTEADIGKTGAETDKLRTVEDKEKLTAPEGRDIANSDLYSSTTAPERAKFRDKEALINAYEKESAELIKMLDDYGTESIGQRSGVMQAKRDNLLAKIKDIKTMGTLDKGLMEWGDNVLGDPTAWTSSADTVKERLRTTGESLRNELEMSAKSIGLGSKLPEDKLKADVQRGSKQAPAAPAKDPNVPVPFLDATGRRVMVPPHLIDTARARQGWIEIDPPAKQAPAPAPEGEPMAMNDVDPMADDYDDQVRRASGY